MPSIVNPYKRKPPAHRHTGQFDLVKLAKQGQTNYDLHWMATTHLLHIVQQIFPNASEAICCFLAIFIKPRASRFSPVPWCMDYPRSFIW